MAQRCPLWLISRSCAGWVASKVVIIILCRVASLEVWTCQSQGEWTHLSTFSLHQTFGFRTHSIGCLEATRERSNWEIVSARFFCLQHYNYRNPLHKIYCSRQGNRSKRRNKWIHVECHTRRSEKRKVTNCKRLVSKSSTSDATSTVEQERVRRISARECGPPLFEINDVVTIVKDASPGASFMHSYDKIGRVTKVVVGNINTYTVKVLFESLKTTLRCRFHGMLLL